MPAPPVNYNLTYVCPEGQVFSHDWFATPFILMTCQVLYYKCQDIKSISNRKMENLMLLIGIHINVFYPQLQNVLTAQPQVSKQKLKYIRTIHFVCPIKSSQRKVNKKTFILKPIANNYSEFRDIEYSMKYKFNN